MLRALLAAIDNEGGRQDALQVLVATGESIVGGLSATVDTDGAKSLGNVSIQDGRSLGLPDFTFGSFPGISGGFPKFLAESPNGKPNPTPNGLWIVKLNDEDHPELTVLEYFGMRLATLCGLPTAEVRLSEDTRRLYVRRFDQPSGARQMRFEDMCSLMSLPARDKYVGSVERIVRVIRELGTESVATDCERFYAQYLVAAVIRNGDAHLKNFGVLIDEKQLIRLAPVFDMLSMGVYAPRSNNGDALDGMALTLRGSRRWPRKDDVTELARLCQVSEATRAKWKASISEALSSVASEAIDLATHHDHIALKPALIRMMELWAHGAALISGELPHYLQTELGRIRS